MPSSKHWSDPEDDEFYDDEGNVLYVDKQGKWRKFNAKNREFQQQYHYYEEDN